MKETHLYIGIPSRNGSIKTACVAGLVSLREAIPNSIQFVDECPYVDMVRDFICASFLKTDATHLLFIDDDIAFHAKDVPLMLDRMEKQKIGVLGALYAKKQFDFAAFKKNVQEGWSTEQLIHAQSQPVFLPKMEGVEIKGPIMDVVGLGMGFTLISREVIQKLSNLGVKYPCQQFNGEILARLFGEGFVPYKSNKLFLREDFWFCHLAREAGFKVCADLSVQLGHVGSHIFETCFTCYEGLGHLVGEPN